MQTLWLVIGMFVVLILIETGISLWLNWGTEKRPSEKGKLFRSIKEKVFKGKAS